MKTEYSGYTAQVPTDPSFYGSCTSEDAAVIASRIAEMIKGQFPGIDVREYPEIGKASTLGPDESISSVIDEWIEANWTAAL